ncbi:porin [Persephonella sp.]
MNRYLLRSGLILTSLFITGSSTAGIKFELDDGKNLEIFQMVQIWNVYTIDNELAGTDIESRNDIYIRRGRIGFKGQINEDVSFKVWFAYDNLGKNEFTAGTGTPNTTAGKGDEGTENRDFYIWDAIWTWHLNRNWANISIGYFRPQVGKESITTAFKVISFQKSLPNFDLRKHIVGRSSGRETGINIGGLKLLDGWSINYNVGIFDTNHINISGNSTDSSQSSVGDGKRWSPLLAFRFAFSIGDPEMKNYRMGYTQTYYGKRNGTTFGLNYTYQGKTDIFDKNGMYGIDLLSNYGAFDIAAEYDWLYRESGTESSTDTIWSIKAGYNIQLNNRHIVQPSVMVSKEDAEKDTLSVTSDKEVYDIGVNYLISKNDLKINLHYVWGKVRDNSFSYIGLGFQFVY